MKMWLGVILGAGGGGLVGSLLSTGTALFLALAGAVIGGNVALRRGAPEQAEPGGWGDGGGWGDDGDGGD